MCTYLLLELFKSQIQGQQQTQTIIKKNKLKHVLHLLIALVK